MAVFQGYNASVYVASGTPVQFTDEATTASSDYKVYTISNSSKRFWSRQYAITVKRNGNIITTGFTIQYPGGKVIFSTAQQPTDVITVSGYYIPVSLVAQAKEWSLDVDVETTESTVFQSQWKTFEVTYLSGSGSLSQWWADEFFLQNLGNLLGFELNVDSTRAYRFFGYLTKDSVKTVADGLVEESLNFVSDGLIYYG